MTTGERVEQAALSQLMEEGINKTQADICLDCVDRRCKSGRICKEFLRRTKAYAWEIAAQNAELN